MQSGIVYLKYLKPFRKSLSNLAFTNKNSIILKIDFHIQSVLNYLFKIGYLCIKKV